MDLKGKMALVTGAGNGIGKGCALELARAGADVFVNDISKKDADQTIQEIQNLGRWARGTFFDMFRDEERGQLFANVLNYTGAIDILVTGPAGDRKCNVLNLYPSDFRMILNRTLVSHFALAQIAARIMVDRGRGGKIIFISSIYGVETRKNHLAYDCAKAAIEQMTRVMARELAEHHIMVNAVRPGFIDTPGERRHLSEEQIREIAHGLPLDRAGTPKDVGEAVAFLASADYITGSVIAVDGGMSLVDFTYRKEERK